MQGMRVLVTGSGGKIGRKLLPKLKQEGFYVVSMSQQVQIHADANILVNWINPEPVSIPEIDFVIDLASQTSAYVARENRFVEAKNNLLNTLNLLEAISLHGNKPNFIHIGSITERVSLESDQINGSYDSLDTFYECAKKVSWMYVNQYSKESIIGKSISLKLANVYGTDSTLSRNERGFIDKVVNLALSGETITIFGDGRYIRDYIRVEDVVDAIFKTLINMQSLRLSEYQIGSGSGVFILDAVRRIVSKAAELTGKIAGLQFRPFPDYAYPIEFRNAISVPHQFILETGWKPKWGLIEGLEDLVEKKFHEVAIK